MTDVEKQESQKTVVAFITGLLIGGLLVWVFSSAPDTAQAPSSAGTVPAESANGNSSNAAISNQAATVVPDGSLTVPDQNAGTMVTLGTVKHPTRDGWIVVRDYMDGVPAGILGAARYGLDEGLIPTQVELLRPTLAGSSYQVLFYTSEGEKGFSSAEDKPIEGISTTFKAL